IFVTRRAVAGEVARSLLRNETRITTPENLDGVLGILSVLIKEGQTTPAGPAGRSRIPPETDESVEEQGWLARIIHLIRAPDNIAQSALLRKAQIAFAEGDSRTKYTTPALMTASLKLARSLKRREHLSNDDYAAESSRLWKFMHTTLSSLYTRVPAPGVPDLCLRLFVSCGQVAAQCGAQDAGYEFFAQAFTIYEESISDSRSQFQAICVISGALCGVGVGGGKEEGGEAQGGFGREEYDTLITKAALHGSKLLKKPDQCRGVYLASHLWWGVEKAERGEGGRE
ncbi:retromer complex subunit Vps35, partial [Teratosphaeriaceae sp. CCFEE 6253]